MTFRWPDKITGANAGRLLRSAIRTHKPAQPAAGATAEKRGGSAANRKAL
jgi:hypothetical protein